MKTYVSIHDITRITATTPGSLGAPVILQLHTDFERQGDVTIFLGDHDLAMRIASAINDAVAKGAEALFIQADQAWNNPPELLPRLIARTGLPAIYFLRASVLAGGLMSYGPDFVAVFRRAASYVDRVLKGAQPGDLPFEHPSTYQLVINLRTAKALGLALPSSLTARADRVIE